MKTSKKQAKLYQITNKENSLYDFILSILNRTLGMFEYTGLPDSLPAVELEKRLQTNGYATVFMYQNNLYVTTGSLNGQEASPYNEPTHVSINVPAFNLSQRLEIGKQCAVIYNDDLKTGLMTTITKHGTLMVENEITMLLSTYNARIQTLISAGTDQTINDAQTYLSQIIDGNLGIIGENEFFNDLKTHNAQSAAKEDMSQLIQLQQFYKSDLYNELGLSSLNNMKKERMNVDEVNANNDNIYPYVDNMLKNRMDGVKMVNKLFNGNVSVDYSSTWKDKAENRNTPNDENTDVNTVDEPKPEPKPEQQPEQKPEPKPEQSEKTEQKPEKTEKPEPKAEKTEPKKEDKK